MTSRQAPVTPDELDPRCLERLLHEACSLPAASVRALRTERIGVGFGLDGVVARLHIDGAGVPPTVVAKWCASRDAERETLAHRIVAPRRVVRIPALLGGAPCPDGRALLLFEDVSPAVQGDVLVGATPAQTAALVDAEAALHAAFWGAEDVSLAELPFWGDAVRDEAERTRAAIPRFLAAYGDRIPDETRAVAERLPDLVPAARRRLAAAPPTLIHADLHLDNVLFRPDGAPVLLDWQSAARGPAAADVAMLLTQCLDVPTRRREEKTLLDRYIAALAAGGVAGYDADRLRADASQAALVLFAGVVRWVARDDASAGQPRVPALLDAIVETTADAVEPPPYDRHSPEPSPREA